MAKFILDPSVEEELWAIWEFIASDNPNAASNFVDAAYQTFRNLALNPLLGRSRPFKNSRLANIRSWKVSGFDNYLVFYRQIPAGVEVLHVYHGARNLEELF